MIALVIGATGATGIHLVKKLLDDDAYVEVKVFVRRSFPLQHTKLKVYGIDFSELKKIKDLITGDVLFSCLGTTLKIAGSKENQWEIDYDIPYDFAKMAKVNGVNTMVLLSAYGASPDSSVFYSRLKGELERDILDLKFAKTIIFKPGSLIRENTDRLGEKLAVNFVNLLNSFGVMKKFRPLPTDVLAEKLAKSPKLKGSDIDIVVLDKIFQY